LTIYRTEPITIAYVGGLSDFGFNSMSSENAHRIVAATSCKDMPDVIPETADCNAEKANNLHGKNRHQNSVFMFHCACGKSVAFLH